jgi:hypothetical protein
MNEGVNGSEIDLTAPTHFIPFDGTRKLLGTETASATIVQGRFAQRTSLDLGSGPKGVPKGGCSCSQMCIISHSSIQEVRQENHWIRPSAIEKEQKRGICSNLLHSK